MLDVVGQCTPLQPTKAGGKGKAPALLAGCGVLDAHTIRTNCCALISLLASAVLATAPVTTATGSSGTESVELAAPADTEENISPEGYANKGGGPTCNNGQEAGGGGGWDTFLPMGAKPSPDVVCLVRKKGWAARQQQLQRPVQPTEAETAAGDSIRSRVPGTYGRVKKKPRREHENARAAGTTGSSSSPVRQAATESASKRDRHDFAAAGSPGKRLNGQFRTRTALNATPFNGTHRSRNLNRHKDGAGLSIDKTGDRALTRNNPRPSREDRQENMEARLSHHHLPMPHCLASPPRLSRAREGGIPELSSGWSFPSGPRHDGSVPLGLSTPGGGNRKSTSKVGCSRVWATPGPHYLWVCGAVSACCAIDSKQQRSRRRLTIFAFVLVWSTVYLRKYFYDNFAANMMSASVL